MARNQTFANPEREPFRDNPSLDLQHDKIHGPFAFLNPTQAHFQHNGKDEQSAQEPDDEKDSDGSNGAAAEKKPQAASNIAFKWTSRNNRKGRHTLVVTPTDPNSPNANFQAPKPTNNITHILHTTWLMFSYYPVWDVSWWVAYIFTWGSIIWVINAMFVFLPDLKPSTEFPNEELIGGGVTAFIGASVFEIGSVLLMIEAVNENRTGCFGWAVEKAISDHEANGSRHGGDAEKCAVLTVSPKKERCTHHHQNRKNFVGQPQQGVRQAMASGKHANGSSAGSSNGDAGQATPSSPTDQQRSWTWWPSKHELRTHYIYDLGFIACASQLVGATIFWIAGLTALPGINNKMSQPILDVFYWLPQVVGGSGFIISGTLFMIETQKHWWQPAPNVLGWHIGLWNLIGGVGFTLCPCFGFDTASWAQYQASCATFWGSWAFLIGSTIQLYESLEKNPVEVA